jgi:hypothetical protein
MMKPSPISMSGDGHGAPDDTILLIDNNLSSCPPLSSSSSSASAFASTKNKKSQRMINQMSRFSTTRSSRQQKFSGSGGATMSSMNGGGGTNSNYWKRSRFSWFCLTMAIVSLVWIYSWYSEHQRKLRFISYLERAEELNSMVKQMETHISSAQLKLQEIKQLQNPDGVKYI